jgi:outer membrane autotransporter protein
LRRLTAFRRVELSTHPVGAPIITEHQSDDIGTRFMARIQTPRDLSTSATERASSGSALRRTLRSQVSGIALRSAIGVAAVAGVSLLAPGAAWADCTVVGGVVQCTSTSTTNTTSPANPGADRHHTGSVAGSPVSLSVLTGATVSGHGLAVTNTSTGGVTVANDGAIVVDAGNTPTQGGTAALSVTAAGGSIIYTGSGSITNNGAGDAVNIVNNGAGTVTVDISGASSSAGGNGVFVHDMTGLGGGGDISVTTGDVTALGAFSSGIFVQTRSSTADITVVANGDIRADRFGIHGEIVLGASGTGDITITANGAVDAETGVSAFNAGSGATIVTTVGPVNATTGNGIFALNTGGALTVNAGDVTSTGNTAILVQQTSVAGGALDVTAGNVSGTTGIFALSTNSAASITTNGRVTGTSAEGILVQVGGDVTIAVADTVTGATHGLSVIGGGNDGDILVTGAGGFVGGTGNAANIQNNGSGTVTVDIAGASRSLSGEGIVVRDTVLGGDISVTTGDVATLTAGRDGIDVQTLSTTADVTVVANGDIQAGNAGIVAAIFPGAGTGDIDVTANGAIDARFGIDAENFGTGSTTVTTVGPINAADGNGIFALTTGGTVTVNAVDVAATGNRAIVAQQTSAPGAGAVDVTAGDVSGTTGIFALNNGTGAVSVTTTGVVIGTTAEGISATGNGAVTIAVADTVTGATSSLNLVGGAGGAGNISVTGAGGFVGGTGNAANIQNNGSGPVTVDISGASSSAGGEGIVVRDTALGGDISVTTGDVTARTAGKDGIDVQTQSLTGDVTIVANGHIQAGNAGIVAAIFPGAGTGDIDVTANGSIDARFGIDAENFGTGSTTVTTVGPVNATTGNGVFALATGGDVTVNAADVTSMGNTAIVARQNAAGRDGAIEVTAGDVSGTVGIFAENLGTGQTRITTTGDVIGTESVGILTTAGVNAGDVVIDAMNVTGRSAGISTVNNGLGATDVTVRGLVQGQFNGVNVTSSASQSANIQNLGTIRNSSGQSSDLALSASGGAIDVMNANVLFGTINLSGNSSQTRNFGSWTSIGGTSAFFGADDRLLNAGTGVIVGSGLAGLAETTVWAGLETFLNSGLIRLQDGGTGDSIQTSANAQFLAGSVMSVDVGGLNSDLFFTTGTVNILPGSVLTVNTAQPLVFGHQYVIVQADAGLTGQFDLADQFMTAFIGLRDGYTATTAFVELAQIRALAEAGLTQNQKETAAGADSLADNDEVKNALLLLPDDAAAIAAFDLLSGEIHPSARTAAVEDSRLPRDAVLNRLSDSQRSGAVWGQAYGGWGRSDDDGNAARLDRDSRGLVFGVDTIVGDMVTLGVAAGWTNTDLELNDRASEGSVESVHGLAYLGAHVGAWRMKAGAGYAETSTDTERRIIFPGVSAERTASYDGSITQAFVEAGYHLLLAWGGHAEPFASVAMVRVKSDAFAENTGLAALSGEAINEDATLTTLGLRFETERTGPFTLRGAAGWRHSTGDLDPVGRHAMERHNTVVVGPGPGPTSPLGAAPLSAPGAGPLALPAFDGGSTFTVLGAAQSENAAFLNIQARWRLTPNVSFDLGYDGVLGSNGEDHAVTGGFKVVF